MDHSNIDEFRALEPEARKYTFPIASVHVGPTRGGEACERFRSNVGVVNSIFDTSDQLIFYPEGKRSTDLYLYRRPVTILKLHFERMKSD